MKRFSRSSKGMFGADAPDRGLHRMEARVAGRIAAFQDLVDALAEPTMVLRGDGVVVAMNDALVLLLGTDRVELHDPHLDLLFGCDVQTSYRLLRAMFETDQNAVVEVSADDGRTGAALELDASPMALREDDRAACALVRVRPAGDVVQRFRKAAESLGRSTRNSPSFRAEASILEREIAQLERLAHIDPLTGLENRGTFDRHLAKALAVVQRDGTPLSLVLIDIDRFKKLNDTWGHERGDRALRAVARVLKPFARRPLDLVARVGGEELAIVLPDCSLRDGLATASRVRRAIEEAAIEHPDGGVTVSIGVAASTEVERKSAKELFVEADQGLYEAKRAGRNRVCAGYAPSED